MATGHGHGHSAESTGINMVRIISLLRLTIAYDVD